MKAQFVGMLALTMTLAACSGGGGSGGNAAAGFSTDLQAESVPQNAVSDQNLRNFGQLLARSNAVIPNEEAYMKVTVNGTDPKATSEGDRQKALGKLSNQGQAVLRTIKGKCQIQEARKTSEHTVAVPYVGAIASASVSSSVGGNGCPLSSKGDASTEVKYTRVDVNGQTVVVEATSNQTMTHAMTASEELARSSGLVSSVIRTKYTGNLSVTKTGNQETKNMRFNIAGSGRAVFANGEKADIKIQGEVVQINDVTNDQMAMEFKISTGVFRIVAGKVNGNSFLYLNGKATTAQQLEQLLPGTNFEP